MQADPLSQTAYSDSPLHEAVKQSNAPLVAAMVRGIAPAALDGLRDSQHNNPLHAAASVGRGSAAAVQTMQVLLAAGVTADSPGEDAGGALRLPLHMKSHQDRAHLVCFVLISQG